MNEGVFPSENFNAVKSFSVSVISTNLITGTVNVTIDAQVLRTDRGLLLV